MNFTPIRGSLDRVVVLPDQAQKTTAGGVIKSAGSIERPKQGEVVSMSKDNQSGNVPIIKVGMKVIFGNFGTAEMELNGKTHLIMREADILGYLTEENG